MTDTFDDVVEEVAEDGYSFYRNLFKAIKEEDGDFDYMTREDVSALAIALVPMAMKRYYSLDYERNDI